MVATPIGNLADITLRALETLQAADIIACEDTRRTRTLLTHYGISATLTALHDHNESKAAAGLVDKIAKGQSVALVSDAGMPMISDPGYPLVLAVREAGLPVTSLPGASSTLMALQLSGLASDRFCFIGFPPPKQAARRRFFSQFAATPATLILFESPRRLAASLGDMAAIFGPRRAAIARELTKLHEEVRTEILPELAVYYRETGAPKGEVVVVVERGDEGPDQTDETSLDAALERALGEGSVKEAVAQVAAITGLPRRQVYERALALKEAAK